MGGFAVMSYIEETFFRFPVKIYDPYIMINIEKQEDDDFKKEGTLKSLPIYHVMGYKHCIPTDIIGWIDSYNKGQTIEDVEENGFPCTVITIKENQETAAYECTWDRIKFEKKLDEFMLKKKLI